ncbi:MAG: hypothetical protein MRERV_1c082 [Mycoplasmataceae bacterium RV_VA103A]|nr:MAG: hypothetical protein MRERV_10c029 [Mycoplasmataceae bacterium RV_VA103A]KLL05401.1 MAG: hypothetical protein MRERV_1c082 [Mycoplasmataceae bacterium RV_VA103A]
MRELFKLEREEFSQEYNEWWWTYFIQFKFTFNKSEINYITITDYAWKKKGREMITKELILKLLTDLSGEDLKPMKYEGEREPYKWETWHEDKPYRLFFWFKDRTNNHLWIRNCHRVD